MPKFTKAEDFEAAVRQVIRAREEGVVMYLLESEIDRYYDADIFVGPDKFILDFYEEREGIKADEGDYFFANLGNRDSGMFMATIAEKDTNGSITLDGETYSKFYIHLPFITTAEEEEAVTDKVNELLSPGGFLYSYLDASDYEKVKACYDYVRSHVSYQSSTPITHTTYNALINGKGTCQAYASLFYRLARELGITNKILMGTDSSAHTYNIVLLDGEYYYLDASAGVFLKGSNSFKPAELQEIYTTEKYKTNYTNKISQTDYQASYTILLDANGGTMEIDNETVTSTSVLRKNGVKYGNLPVPKKKSYIFMGWYTAQNGGTKITETSIVKLSENVTLFARWEGVKVTSVDITKDGESVAGSTLSIDLGGVDKTISLISVITPTDAAEGSIIWKSSKPTVATVDENGVVTGVTAGTAVISATASDGSGKSAQVTIVVAKLVKNIKISGADEIGVGKSTVLSTVATPDSASNKAVIWESLTPEIAKISSQGKLTALAIGTAVIRATAADGSGSYAEKEIGITALTEAVNLYKMQYDGGEWKAVEHINGKKIGMDADATNTCEARISAETVAADSNAKSSQKVNWKSSNTRVASVVENEDGSCTIQALKKGTAVITAAALDGSGKKASVTVNVSTQVTSVLISGSCEVALKKSTVLTGTVIPDSSTTKKLSWNSSNTDIATVSNSGKVTAKAVGVTKITAFATDGSNVVSNEFFITVTEPADRVIVKTGENEVGSVELDLAAEEKKTINFSAEVVSQSGMMDNVCQAVTWKTSKAAVANVDENGMVTALSPGTVIITATAADGTGKKTSVKVTVVSSEIQVIGENSVASGKNLKLTAIGPKVCEWEVSASKDDYNEGRLITIKNGTLRVDKSVESGTVLTVRAWSENRERVSEKRVIVFDPANSVAIYTDDGGKDVSKSVIGIDRDKMDMTEIKLTAKVLSKEGSTDSIGQDVEWKSSNTSIADILEQEDGSCIVIPKKAGKAKITATAADGTKKSVSTTINIASLVETIKLSGVDEVARGKYIGLTADVFPQRAANRKVSWVATYKLPDNYEGDIPAKAITVSNGKLCVSNQVPVETLITVKALATDGSGIESAEYTVTVTEPAFGINVLCDQINVTGTKISVDRDILNPIILHAEVYNAMGTTGGSAQGVTWKSSNVKVAMIQTNLDGSCTVIPLKAGSAVITATTSDGTKRNSKVTVVVQ